MEERKGHVDRFKEVLTQLESRPTGKHCKGMEGLIEEGKEAREEDQEAPQGDILIGPHRAGATALARMPCLLETFVFLESADASYVSGEIYSATGGRTPL